MKFYNSGNQDDPVLTKMDEPCGASRRLLPCSGLWASLPEEPASHPDAMPPIHPHLRGCQP